MSPAPFRFSLQPRLDDVARRRREAELWVDAARRALAEARATLGERRLVVAGIVQQEADLRENRSGMAPARRAEVLAGEDGVLALLRIRRDEARTRLAEAADAEELAADLAAIREEELAALLGEEQALERLKERREQEHRAGILRREDEQNDESAIQGWNRRRPEQ